MTSYYSVRVDGDTYLDPILFDSKDDLIKTLKRTVETIKLETGRPDLVHKLVIDITWHKDND